MKFNPKNKKTLTYGECLGPAMEITDPAEAQEYFMDYVAYTEARLKEEENKEGLTAEQIVKANLGYYAGYYGNDVRERVEKLFSCSHPIFGAIKYGVPTAKEAFELGKKIANENL